jgi:hypothetical protein
MSNSTLKKFVLTPVVISAAVFGTLTLPLAIFGKQVVTLQLQQEPVFQGQLRDAATPYLGLASLVSLGAGFASIAFSGWQRSTRKSSQVEAQLSDLAKHLQEKEAQIEALKLAESQLVVSGLKAFVDEDVPLEQALNKPEPSQNTSKVEILVNTNQSFETKPVVVPSDRVQEAARQFASAQSFLGYAQPKAAPKSPTNEAQMASQEVEELHDQLQQIMAQMASVQAALSAKRPAINSEVQASEKENPPQVVQPWSVH